MKMIRPSSRLFLFLLIFFSVPSLFAQVHVTLDNWYNHETSSKTGKPFHYMWSDTLNSGYSQFGEVFTSKGGVLSMVSILGEQARFAVRLFALALGPGHLAHTHRLWRDHFFFCEIALFAHCTTLLHTPHQSAF